MFTKRDLYQDETESICDGVVDIVNATPYELIVQHRNNVMEADNSVLHLLGNKVKDFEIPGFEKSCMFWSLFFILRVVS